MKNKVKITILFLLSFILIISCSKNRKLKLNIEKGIYLDSLEFHHYKKLSRPYLISSYTYAFNDSMSQVLDSLNLKKLIAINSVDRSYDDPLSYSQKADTILVDLVYTPNEGRFAFGEIRIQGDSMFLKLSGDVYQDIPKNLNVNYRYFKSKFKILSDSNISYKIFFSHK